MSKYELQDYPQDKYRFSLYHNTRKLTWRQIKAEQGCFALCNLVYFDMSTFTPCPGLIVGGHTVTEPEWNEYGVCIDADGYISCDTQASESGKQNYAVAYPPMLYQGKNYAAAKYFAKNGTTMIGFRADGTPVVLLCGKDDGMTSTEAVGILKDDGCVTVLRYDGSWSTQGDLGNGKEVQPSETRIVPVYLLIFERTTMKEDKPLKKVCLDPGHGVETAGKCSPDKTYYEHEFNLDLVRLMKPMLERHGVEVTLTRNDEHAVTLANRVKTANDITDLDLFVSVHTNAAGNNGWYGAKGLTCYTSAVGNTAGRNIAAKAMLARFREAGITLRGTPLAHVAYYVLRKTYAPAVLIEHGFHTNKEEAALLKTSAYRDKLAVAECKGILDYLGIAWVEETDYASAVQERFGLSDAEITYLAAYENADALLEALATKN